MPLFPRPYTVIRRVALPRVNGRSVPPAEADPVVIPMDVQPASQSDYLRLDGNPNIAPGRRVTGALRAYCDHALSVAGEDQAAGDIVLAQGRRWLIIGRAQRDALLLPPISHFRYLMVPEAEAAAGEVMA